MLCAAAHRSVYCRLVLVGMVGLNSLSPPFSWPGMFGAKIKILRGIKGKEKITSALHRGHPPRHSWTSPGLGRRLGAPRGSGMGC